MLFQPSIRPILIHRILPHIVAYRQTPFTLADWISEHRSTTRYHSLWREDDFIAFCKTDETAKGHLYLSSFLIAEDARGQGWSRPFLTSVLQGAATRGYTRIALKVHEDNRVPQRLYTSTGFQTKQKFNQRYEMELNNLKSKLAIEC